VRKSPAATPERLMREGMETFVEGVKRWVEARGDRSPRSLSRSPGRVVTAWRDELLAGYRQDPDGLLAPLAARSSEHIVAIRDIVFSSICVHHLLPFSGVAHLVYAPDGRITGLSRLGRLVDCLSRRLQLQEPLTRQIADCIQRSLAPHGAGCVIEATHACVTMRGNRKAASRIVTMAFTGVFETRPARRREALSALGLPGYRVSGKR